MNEPTKQDLCWREDQDLEEGTQEGTVTRAVTSMVTKNSEAYSVQHPVRECESYTQTMENVPMTPLQDDDSDVDDDLRPEYLSRMQYTTIPPIHKVAAHAIEHSESITEISADVTEMSVSSNLPIKSRNSISNSQPCESLTLVRLTNKKKTDTMAQSQTDSQDCNMGVPVREQCTTTSQPVSTMSNLSEVPADYSVSTQNSVPIHTAGTCMFEQEVSRLQPSSDVQAEKSSPNFSNQCPLPNNIVLSHRCDHSGGTLASKYGDIKITIPEGAIRDEDIITFHIAADLYGPFVLPSQCQTDLLSPYYWVGISELSYYIQKPIKVEFQHFAACDTSHYKLLTCEDDDNTYTMRPIGHDLEFKKQDNISWCAFTTYHFCSYCLYHDHKDPITNRIGAYYLKPDNFRYLTDFTVEVWFSFPISLCLQRNEQLYKKKHMILNDSHIFEASCDSSSKSYFTVQYNQTVGWDLQKSLLTILTKKVNFYNYYTSVAALKANEESHSFPPRFIIHVVQETECTKDLNTNITVTLYEEENKPDEFYLFKLAVSLSARPYYNGPQSYSLSLPSHCCDEHKPLLRDLLLYSEEISSEWKRIAARLNIPKGKIDVIDIDNQHSVTDKCYRMFVSWLQSTVSPGPCWCHFIEALIEVRLYEVAERVQQHLESPDNGTRTSMASGNDTLMQSVASPVAGNNTHMQTDGDPLNLANLIEYLQDVPQEKLIYFARFLLPTNVIKDVRKRSTTTPTDLLENVCNAFLNEAHPSWLKVYEALKKAKLDNLAEIIEACCLPV